MIDREEDIDELVGNNAGAIAMRWNSPYQEPFKIVIDGGAAAQESLAARGPSQRRMRRTIQPSYPPTGPGY